MGLLVCGIEDYRPGYPRFTALLSAHGPYFLCRCFNQLRARLLLLKQDKLSTLEQRLDEIDQHETSPLFLGKSRSDRNADRLSLLSDIETCLADYDQFAERTHRMLSFGSAEGRDVRSLQNWLDGTGCLAREETAYLTHSRDLVSLAPAGDNAVLQLETWVEDKLIRFYRGFRKRRFHDQSTDPNVYIYSGPLIKRTAKALLLYLITLLLVMPAVICNIVSTISIRIIIVMASTISYLLILSGLTKSRTMELILAGATYATVLIVFVSGTSAVEV
ncbi:hypothetical protein QBC46DRAFT_461337 [Diplogelasinospora grovesii]|uniref:DUF6594 domain-containing protein n=1 Tax=Diplogelasinospora grovesii TaxID=303347 RepID=A0AAN6N0D5_9PEZI|nr:hypothetical protein QBC46DRAFT_461337 [Diplogelasinospora grovesii]